MENFESIKKQIDELKDPEVLKSTLLALLQKVDDLEQRLDVLSDKPGNNREIITKKRDRLEILRHGLTEMNERMEKPYVISAELQNVKEVLDVLAESGDCNSVILEGEPGTGKTQWAYSEVGQELQEGKDVMLVHVRVKDTMRAQDLLYSVDDVRRLSDAQAKSQIPDEIREEAIFWREKIVSGQVNPAEDEEYNSFKVRMEAVTELGETAKDLDYLNYIDLGPLGEAIYQSGKGKKVYLLIDEIEKGREELMTGILDEIENLTFKIGETGDVIKGDKRNLRIVVTTNTEDSDKIPASFRRRSLYHYIDYPSRSDMAKIVKLNFPDIQEDLLDYAISTFYKYQENSEIEKKPSTPELLAWIRALSENYSGSIPDDIPYKEVLLKYKTDQNFEAQKNAMESNEGLSHHVRRAFQGFPVYLINSEINDYSCQNEFPEFFAELHNKGVNFITPEFEEDEEREEIYLTRKFQVVMPGVEDLGDDYYIISDERLSLFNSVIEKKLEVLPSSYKFKSITKKSGEVVFGKIEVDGCMCDAFMGKDGRFVISTPFN